MSTSLKNTSLVSDQNSEQFRALYYPYIHFRDIGWLRRALLYWDQVGRIVPQPEWSIVKDEPFVEELKDQELIIDEPAETGASSLENDFIQLLSKHEDALTNRYGVQKWKPKLKAKLSKAEYLKIENQANYVRLYLDKIPPNLRQSFINAKLGFKLDDSDEILLHKDLAGVYMTALARKIAKNDYQPVTDNVINHYALEENNAEKIAQVLLPKTKIEPNFSTLEETVASIALFSFKVAFPEPKNLEEMTTKKFLKLRNAYRNDVPDFRADIENFVHQHELLSECVADRAKFIKRLQESYADTLKRQLKKRDKIVKEIWKDTAKSMLFMSPMALLSKGLPAMGITLEPVSATIGALALTAIPLIQKQQKEARSKLGPALYFMHLNEEVDPGDRKAILLRKARNFFFRI